MTESQWTGKLLKELRRRMPDAVIIKFNDRSTGGIPDFCIVRNGVTSWWEVKYNNRNPYERLQWTMLQRMKGSYIIATKGMILVFKVKVRYGESYETGPLIGTLDDLVSKLCEGEQNEKDTVYDSMRRAINATRQI